MHCPVRSGNPEILLDYCARTLRPELVVVLEEHMRTCAECGSFAEGQQQIWSALDAWSPEPVSLDFDSQLYSRIEARSQQSLWSRLRGDWFTWKPALPLAAVCGTALLAVILGYPPETTQSPQPAQPTRVESLEPEQVERTLEDIEMLRQLTAPAAAPASARSL